jgi:hypothetical protein
MSYAKAHFKDGPDVVEAAMDAIRKEAEAADCLQGF